MMEESVHRVKVVGAVWLLLAQMSVTNAAAISAKAMGW
jgi:hypothetical protein